NAAVVDAVNIHHENPFYLATVPIPQDVLATRDFREALADAQFIILAAPSHVTRDLLNEMLPALRGETILISATKGIEIETGKRISQVVDDVVGSKFSPRFVCLSGPSF